MIIEVDHDLTTLLEKFDDITGDIISQYLSKYDIVKGKQSRKLLLQQKGTKAFLIPHSMKFPIMTFQDTDINPNLVYVTCIRLLRLIKTNSAQEDMYKELYNYCLFLLCDREYEPIYVRTKDDETLDLLKLATIIP